MERTPTAPVPQATATLFGLQGRQLTRLGAVLMGAGVLCWIAGFALMLTSFGGAAAQAFQDPSLGFGTAVSGFVWFAILGIVGFILLGVGLLVFRMGIVRPVARYVAVEAGPAVHFAARSLGEGFREGFGASPAAAPAVKVKCRNCGYLDSEDATYCSKCGQPL